MELVSVIMPTFRRPQGLLEALESVAAQTWGHVEAVVVDDAGDLNERGPMAEVMTAIRAKAPHLPARLVRHETNRGASAARNSGLAVARGRYVCYLDDDDIFFPEHIETLVRALRRQGTMVAYSDAELAYTEGEPPCRTVLERRLVHSRAFDPGALLVANYIPLPGLMHERACLSVTGGFDEALSTLVDWDFLIRLSLSYPFLHVKKTTARYHKTRDPEQRSNLSAVRRYDALRNLVAIHCRYHRAAARNPFVLVGQRHYLVRQAGAALQSAVDAGDTAQAVACQQLLRLMGDRPLSPARFRDRLQRAADLLGAGADRSDAA